MTSTRIPADIAVIDDARPCKLTFWGRACLAGQVIYNRAPGAAWLGSRRAKPRTGRDWSGVELRRQGRRWGLVRTGRTM